MEIKIPAIISRMVFAGLFVAALFFITAMATNAGNSLVFGFASLVDSTFHNPFPLLSEGGYSVWQISPAGYVIGFLCFGLVVSAIIIGLVCDKRRLAFFGASASFLPTFGYFGVSMFFLFGGLAFLRALYIPVWGEMMRLGDVFLLPNLAYLVVLPSGNGARIPIPWIPAMVFGVIILFFGMLAWFRGKLENKKIIDFGIYRWSRHPQYLGWIVWSYGLMIAADQTLPARGGENIGASLPWMISSLAIVCVAAGEEMQLRKVIGPEYLAYQKKTPFLFPLPGLAYRIAAWPYRMIMRKEAPDRSYELAIIFLLYLVIFSVMSLPLILLHFPRMIDWVAIWK
jgi:protein-S-isoprenylcysteine O-methyltransferase Ste14